jgi:hypothetical protein
MTMLIFSLLGVVLLVLVVIVFLYSLVIYAFLRGAEYALKNPPVANRITFLRWDAVKDILGIENGKGIYTSEPFLFSPQVQEPHESENEKISFLDMTDLLGKVFPKKSKGGKKFGSLSSSSVEQGTKISEILYIVRDLMMAEDRDDGSFREVCERYNLKYTTGKDWVRRYGHLITNN